MINNTLRYIHPSIQYVSTNYTFDTTILPNTFTIPHIIKLFIAFVLLYIIVNNIANLYVKVRECNRRRANKQQELPFTMPKKAKESPYIAPEVPKILPKCPTLDGAERGQNVMVRFRMPYVKKAEEPFVINFDHKITIRTELEDDVTQLDSPV